MVAGAWSKALRTYCYPVVLSQYQGRERFPNHFKQVISGDRDSTIAFENYFRNSASQSIAVYCGVVFWKLYGYRDQNVASRIIDGIDVEPSSLFLAVNKFVETPALENLKEIRRLLGMSVEFGNLPVALTFPTFMNPERYPMLDSRIALWVNQNLSSRSTMTTAQLREFHNPKSLADLDFQSYINWVFWCREIAGALTKITSVAWRARDAEMAVFSAEKQGLKLEPL